MTRQGFSGFVWGSCFALALLLSFMWAYAGDQPRQNTLVFADPDCIKIKGEEIHIVCPEDGEVLLVFYRGETPDKKLMKDAVAIEKLLKQLDSVYTANAEKKK